MSSMLDIFILSQMMLLVALNRYRVNLQKPTSTFTTYGAAMDTSSVFKLAVDTVILRDTVQVGFFETLMMSEFVCLFFIFLLSGLLGGWGAFWYDKSKAAASTTPLNAATGASTSISGSKRSSSKKTDVLPALGYFVLGVVASFTVPLFFSMFNLDLMESPCSDISKVFALIGACLVAAVFSRTFLAKIAEKVFDKFNVLKKDVDSIKSDTAAALTAISEPPRTAHDTAAVRIPDQYKPIIEHLENGEFPLQTLETLSEKAQMDPTELTEAIRQLEKQGIAAKITLDDGVVRWYRTNAPVAVTSGGNSASEDDSKS